MNTAALYITFHLTPNGQYYFRKLSISDGEPPTPEKESEISIVLETASATSFENAKAKLVMWRARKQDEFGKLWWSFTHMQKIHAEMSEFRIRKAMP